MTNKFFVQAVWDEEANVYYSKSNIPGLHIEAKVLGAFEDVMRDVVPELLVANVVESARQNQPLASRKKCRSVPESISYTFKVASNPREIIVSGKTLAAVA